MPQSSSSSFGRTSYTWVLTYLLTYLLTGSAAKNAFTKQYRRL